MKRLKVILLVFACLVATAANAQEKLFSQLTGPLTPGKVDSTEPVELRWITWGGEAPLFLANGLSTTTKAGSTFDKLGLKVNLVQGDDFVDQVRAYVKGETPYVRGTFRMLGMASEVLNTSPDTKPVVFLQLTFSLGDHLVCVEPQDQWVTDPKTKLVKNVKKRSTIPDLKGKTIILQTGGPHVGLVDDTLAAGKLSWDDVQVEWVPDLTGPNGPAESLRKKPAAERHKYVACVITPDMIGLCTDIDSVGSGGDDTVAGARVINSTSVMNRSVADVWAVRSDYLKENPEKVKAFVAGYLAATEQVVAMRAEYNKSGSFAKGTGPKYKSLLLYCQQTFGEEVIPTIEEDGHGLLLDAQYVGLPGNISFFTDEGNLNGFGPKLESALNLATSRGYATKRLGFTTADWDYREIAKLAGIEYKTPTTQGRIKAESIDFFDEELDDKTLVSFTIQFGANQQTFQADEYGSEFDRAVKAASDFGNAVVLIRGHSDTNAVLADMVRAGISKGIIKRTGQRGNRKYFINGRELDLAATDLVVKLIESGAFDGTNPNPRERIQSALSLSKERADNVKKAILEFAQSTQKNIDETQIQTVGVGVSEPIVARPRGPKDSLTNMRVEFRIVRVKAESINTSDYDY